MFLQTVSAIHNTLRDFNTGICRDCDPDINQASAIVNGIKRCFPCSALAPLSSAVRTSNHSSSYYPDTQHCYCPTADYCNRLYNGDSPHSMSVSRNCECYCNSSYGFQGDTRSGCSCANLPDPYPDPHPGVGPPQHRFTSRNNADCGCVTAVSQNQCNGWFPGENRVPSGTGCSCVCRNSGGFRCDRDGGVRQSDCSCSCNPNWIDPVDPNGIRCSVCSLDNDVCENTLGPGATVNSSDCTCRPDCSSYDDAYYDPGSNTCRCICGGSLGSCTDCGGVSGE